jgi:hypothetical protein
MSLVLALLVLIVILWLLGVGKYVHFNADIHLGGGLHTILIIVLVVALLALLLRRF